MGQRHGVAAAGAVPALNVGGRPVLGRARLAYLIASFLGLAISVYVAGERYPDTEILHCIGQDPADVPGCIGVYVENGIQRARIIVAGVAVAIVLFGLAFRRRLDVPAGAPVSHVIGDG